MLYMLCMRYNRYMAKRKTEYTTDTVANLRVSRTMKDEIDNLADAEGISSAEWMRRVLQKELDRVYGRNQEEKQYTKSEIKDAILELKKEGVI